MEKTLKSKSPDVKSALLPVEGGRFAILGYGSWGTALLKILVHQFYPVQWYVRREAYRDFIFQYKHNPRYLSTVALKLEERQLFTQPAEAVENVDAVILATPAFLLHELLEQVPVTMLQDKLVVSAIKGVLPKEKMTVTQFLHHEMGLPYAQLATITGPCHAEEIAQEKLSYLTFASGNEQEAQNLARYFSCHYVKTACTHDVFGTELGAVLKNVFAIAAGMAHGLAYGDNFLAVLVSNAVQEMQQFLKATDDHHPGILSTSYLGDLLVTAYSQHSRNRTFGNLVGRGYSVLAAQMEMGMIAEGYNAVQVVHFINQERYAVSMPITATIYRILYQKTDPKGEFLQLADMLN